MKRFPTESSGIDTPWWGEYLAQYKHASRFVRGAKVLDIGCGQGYGSRLLFEWGALEVTGIDINSADILQAQERQGRDGVGFVVADAKNLPFAPKSFDIVTCFQVFEKMASPDLVLQQIHRVLTPEGKAIISTVNRKRNSALSEAPVEATHLQEFDVEEFKAMLRRTFPQQDVRGLFCTRLMGPDLLVSDNKALEFFRHKIENRIPWKIRDAVAKKIFGVSYFPDETEYVLRSQGVTEAPILFAVCTK